MENSYNQYFDKTVKPLTTGAKLKIVRRHKKISREELGKACGVKLRAVDNFLSGERDVSEQKLILLAKRLNVPVEALRDRNLGSVLDLIHILFEASTTYRLVPAIINEGTKYVIETDNDALLSALREWHNKEKDWEQQKISSEEYEEWKYSFPFQCEQISEPTETPSQEHLIPDNERVIYMRKSLEDLALAVNSYCELIANNLDRKNTDTALEHLNALKRTVNSHVKNDVKKFG